MSESNITNYSAKIESALVYTRRSRFERFWIELRKAPLTAWIGMITVSLYIFVALFAPFIAPYGEAEDIPVPYDQ